MHHNSKVRNDTLLTSPFDLNHENNIIMMHAINFELQSSSLTAITNVSSIIHDLQWIAYRSDKDLN